MSRDEVFLINENGSLSPLRKHPYPEEAELQALLAKFPEVISGSQIDPQEPRRWLLVTRELGISDEGTSADRWSLDHLFLDQEGIPTLVEVKRSSDTRIRREVVGQMLDYAANAVLYWSLDRIQAEFEAACSQRQQDPEAVLRDFAGDFVVPEEFWQKVKTNLQAGKIRMIFVADSIPMELRRIVEFLNEQMDPAEVLALELPQFAGGGLRTLVPKVIGLTAESEARKRPGYRRQPRSAEEIWALFGPGEAGTARRIHDWLVRRTGVPQPTATGFSMRLADETRNQSLFQLTAPDHIAIWFRFLKDKPPFSDRGLREQLAERLNQIPGISISPEKLEGMPKIPLSVLQTADSVEAFLKVMDWAVERITGHSSD